MSQKTFICRTLAVDGTVRNEHKTAENIELLRSELEKTGQMIIDISEQNPFASIIRTSNIFREKITSSDISLLSKELAILLRSGLPMASCLAVLSEHASKKRIKAALLSVKTSIEGGSTLSDAMSSHPDLFSEFYCTTVRSGESTDNMVTVFKNMSEYYKAADLVRKKVASALIYPLFLFVLAFFAVAYLLVFVVPVFAKLYTDLGQSLPFLTSTVMSASGLLRSYYMIFLLVLVIVWYAAFVQFKTEARRLSDRIILKLPVIREISVKSFVARFCRTVAMLLRSGVPLIKAIETAERSADNSVISGRLAPARERLAAGEPFSASMKSTGYFPSLSVEMIHTGEQTGALDEMLDNVAEVYEENVSSAVSSFLVIIEPLMMLVMGIFIAFILLAMYLPIFELSARF